MKVCATSDLHGHLPEIPECDLLLIAGDICPATNHKLPYQRRWLREKFAPWLQKAPANEIAMTWGNHDWVGMFAPRDVPPIQGAHVLIDELREVAGMKVWGSPWTLEFFNWAFNATAEEIETLHSLIPQCDIILTHGPAYGYGDMTPRGERVGSPQLTEAIRTLQPRLVVGGHIHCSQGVWRIGESIVANVAHVGEDYQPCLEPQVFEI